MQRENRWRHLALLICILLLFTATPLFVGFRQAAFILNVIAAPIMVSGAYALSSRKHEFAIAVCLSVISVITTWLMVAFPGHWTVIASRTCLILLLGFFAVTILGYVLRRGKVTSDKIFAAICVYMLIGYTWAFAYALLDELQPGSFSASTDVGPSNYASRVVQLRYFSFVTLTTVGYGDIVPRSPVAQTMAVLESVTGQIFLTVLIARLVGLHIVHGLDSPSADKTARF